jgi:hypothetical protein
VCVYGMTERERVGGRRVACTRETLMDCRVAGVSVSHYAAVHQTMPTLLGALHIHMHPAMIASCKHTCVNELEVDEQFDRWYHAAVRELSSLFGTGLHLGAEVSIRGCAEG